MDLERNQETKWQKFLSKWKEKSEQGVAKIKVDLQKGEKGGLSTGIGNSFQQSRLGIILGTV